MNNYRYFGFKECDLPEQFVAINTNAVRTGDLHTLITKVVSHWMFPSVHIIYIGPVCLLAIYTVLFSGFG